MTTAPERSVPKPVFTDAEAGAKIGPDAGIGRSAATLVGEEDAIVGEKKEKQDDKQNRAADKFWSTDVESFGDGMTLHFYGRLGTGIRRSQFFNFAARFGDLRDRSLHRYQFVLQLL